MLNLRGLLLNISVYGIVSAGMTILFVSKGIDLSIGTVMAFIGVFLGESLARGFPVPLVIISTILLGAIIGASIGVLVTKIGINPFIVTLAYFFCFKGLAFLFGLIFVRTLYLLLEPMPPCDTLHQDIQRHQHSACSNKK